MLRNLVYLLYTNKQTTWLLLLQTYDFSDDADEICELMQMNLNIKFVRLGKIIHKIDYSKFEMYLGKPYAPIEIGVTYSESYIKDKYGDIEYINTSYKLKYPVR